MNKCIQSFKRFTCQSKANGDCCHARLDRGGCVHVRWGGSLIGHLCDSPEAQAEAEATWLRQTIADHEERVAALDAARRGEAGQGGGGKPQRPPQHCYFPDKCGGGGIKPSGDYLCRCGCPDCRSALDAARRDK